MSLTGGVPICVGNWKAHGSQEMLRDWAGRFASAPAAEIILCVPHPLLPVAAKLLAGVAAVGAQDVSAGSGNHTGNTTAELVVDSGATWTLVGHSERRALGETDEVIASKLMLAQDAGLKTILCIGERLEEREQGKLEQVLNTQLERALEGVSSTAGIVVAYEPVWAIGTGVAAKPEDVQRACVLMRGKLETLSGSAKIPILYGGSVKSGNAVVFMVEADIDGLLVGGASLDPESFTQIGQAVASVKKR